MNFDITLSGQPYTLTTSDDAQIAAIAACRQKFNDALPQTIKQGEEDVANPDLLPDDAAYLEYVFGHWAAANPGFVEADLQATFASAAASYAGQIPPEQAIEQAELTGDALKAALRAYAAAKRWRIETGGMVSNTFGAMPTDRETRGLLGDIIQSIDLGITTAPIRFKSATGFVSLDRTALVAMAAEIAEHVQDAFDAEDAIFADIEAETITTTAEIDAYAWA